MYLWHMLAVKDFHVPCLLCVPWPGDAGSSSTANAISLLQRTQSILVLLCTAYLELEQCAGEVSGVKNLETCTSLVTTSVGCCFVLCAFLVSEVTVPNASIYCRVLLSVYYRNNA